MPLLATLLCVAASGGGDGETPEATESGFPLPVVNVYGNLFGRSEDQPIFDIDGNPIDDVVRLRQVDVDIRSPLTEQADAVLVLSVETDPNNTEYELELERAYLTFRGLPLFHHAPWNLGFQVGHYRTHFGWMNQVPITDLPQITRPRALTNFFGEDGYAQLGVAMTVDIPFPSEERPVRFVLEQIESGDRPFTDDTPSGRVSGQGLRLEWEAGSDEGTNLILGASRFRGQQADGDERRTTLVGLDALFSRSWREGGEGRGFHVGAEWIDGEVDQTGGPATEPSGYYLWSQLQLSKTWYVGARYDVSQELFDPTRETETVGLFFSRDESERLRYAIGIERSSSDLAILDGATRVFTEINFAFGSRIRRPFWIRR